MSRLLITAFAATLLATGLPTAFTATPSLAQYSCEPGQPNCVPIGKSSGTHKTPWPQIACRVPGESSEVADDLRFTNIGDVLIPGGTAVFWHLKQTGEHGSFLLKRDLPVGAEIDDADVLNAGLPGKTRCLSRLT
jgi:hypothetical protein